MSEKLINKSNSDNSKSEKFKEEDYKESSSIYLELLTKCSNQIVWLIFAIVTIIGTNDYLILTSRYGNIQLAMDLNSDLLSKKNDSLKVLKLQIYKDSVLLKSFQQFDTLKENLVNVLNFDSIKNSHDSQKILINSELETWLPKKAILENKILFLNGNISNVQEVQSKLRTLTLPFLGITLFNSDFILCYFMIGAVFVVWLYYILNYTLSLLKRLYNNPNKINLESETVTSLFYLILPRYNAKWFYKYVESLILIFLLSTIYLLLDDLYDFLYIVYKLVGVSFSEFYENYTGFVRIKIIIEVSCLLISLYMCREYHKVLRDIRNLLILINWSRVGLAYSLKKKLNLPPNLLISVEYKRMDESNRCQLNILFTKKDILSLVTNNSNQSSNEIMDDQQFAETQIVLKKGDYISLRSNVNLANDLKKFNRHHDSDISRKYIYDIKLQRRLTSEEIFMRNFFSAILQDEYYEKDLVSKVIITKNEIELIQIQKAI